MIYPIAVTVNNKRELEYAENHEGVTHIERKLDDAHEDGEYDRELLEGTERIDLDTIVTFLRPAEQVGKKYPINDTTLNLLKEIGPIADYVDIELHNVDYSPISDEEYIKRRDKHTETAHDLNLDVIVSWHDYESTPSLEKLEEVRDEEIQAGADIAKICTTAETLQDNVTMSKLHENSDHPMLAWAMGVIGRPSRYLEDNEWVFASIGEKSASGQLPVKDVCSIGNLTEKAAKGLLEGFSEYDYAMSVK